GLECFLALDRGVHPEPQGNLLLDRLLGAHVRFVESQDPADAVQAMEELAEQLRAQGRTPYVIPRGGSVPVGATGYANFVPELLDQLEELGVQPSALYIATGSCGTHSGILAGLAATGHPFPLRGISVSRNRAQQEEKVQTLASATLDHLGIPIAVEPEHAQVDDRFVGKGYGYPTAGTMEAIEILARDEGIILDPVYTGKAMAGLIAHMREGTVQPGDTVVFLHTGGTPALFAYNHELVEALPMDVV
ncbi:MAG: pyridoxal-phosphate dependent enzyme, partial [Chloroflexota bacterium]|nr:pyridoxal-phosphate dependent enzyme [Chloroflexota bacterium]